jgi:hypothetical protein
MADWMYTNNGQDVQKSFLRQRYIEISSWMNKNQFCYRTKSSPRDGHTI